MTRAPAPGPAVPPRSPVLGRCGHGFCQAAALHCCSAQSSALRRRVLWTPAAQSYNAATVERCSCCCSVALASLVAGATRRASRDACVTTCLVLMDGGGVCLENYNDTHLLHETGIRDRPSARADREWTDRVITERLTEQSDRPTDRARARCRWQLRANPPWAARAARFTKKPTP